MLHVFYEINGNRKEITCLTNYQHFLPNNTDVVIIGSKKYKVINKRWELDGPCCAAISDKVILNLEEMCDLSFTELEVLISTKHS